MAKDEYWFNIKTLQVEIGKQSLSHDRIGPFDSLEEARRAPEIIAERAKKIRDEDAEEWTS